MASLKASQLTMITFHLIKCFITLCDPAVATSPPPPPPPPITSCLHVLCCAVCITLTFSLLTSLVRSLVRLWQDEEDSSSSK